MIFKEKNYLLKNFLFKTIKITIFVVEDNHVTQHQNHKWTRSLIRSKTKIRFKFKNKKSPLLNLNF